MAGFDPRFTITPAVASALMGIESAREAIRHLPIIPAVLATLRETARLYSTHYSTVIEGNRLTQEQVSRVLGNAEHFPGRERDEHEVLGYYAALERVEQLAEATGPVTEQQVRQFHALVMAGGRRRVRATPYRDGQMRSWIWRFRCWCSSRAGGTPAASAAA